MLLHLLIKRLSRNLERLISLLDAAAVGRKRCRDQSLFMLGHVISKTEVLVIIVAMINARGEPQNKPVGSVAQFSNISWPVLTDDFGQNTIRNLG